MTRLFLSLDFKSDLLLAQQIKDELKHHGVEGVIAGDLAKEPPPEVVRGLILSSDGLLAIITSEDDEWIQNEIGIAYAADLPVYGMVKVGVSVGGLLPQITTYERIAVPYWGFELRKKIAVIEGQLRKSSAIQAVVDTGEVIVGSNGTLQIAIRPRRIPSGDEIIVLYVPPDFRIRIITPRDEIGARFLPRRTSRRNSTECVQD